MENNDKRQINITLDVHRLSFSVNADKEPVYRQAAAHLNSRYAFYQKKMPRATVEQLWMYVAFETALSLCDDTRKKRLQPIEQRVQDLNQQLSNFLSSSAEDDGKTENA